MSQEKITSQVPIALGDRLLNINGSRQMCNIVWCEECGCLRIIAEKGIEYIMTPKNAVKSCNHIGS